MIKVKNKITKEVSYFRFFSSMKYPNCFWHTKTTESNGFELSKREDYIPLNTTWEKLLNDQG